MDDLALVAGPLHLVALVLTVSGGHKLVEPGSARRAMLAAGVPAGVAHGRVVGAAEVASGAALLAFGGPGPAIAVGTLYAAFGAFLLVLRRRDDAAPCGCFGATAAPPGAMHLVLNLASVAVVVAALVTEAPALTDVIDAAGAGELVAYAALVLAGTLGIIGGSAVVDDIRHTTDLMKA